MPTEIPSAPKRTGSEFIRSVRPFAAWFVGGFALLTLFLRFAPLPENFATFGALALFCGLFLQGPARWIAPVALLFIADCIGQALQIPGMGFYHLPAMLLNYLAFALVASLGAGLSRWWNLTSAPLAMSMASLPLGAIAGSALFFLVSNFGAWIDPRMGYETSLAGLGQCYWMGLPFWRSTLASDLCFGVGFPAAAWTIANALGARPRAAAH
ncbi:MAG: DUF6580 family putative transport protein [Planctomycetota bacterium]|jgi:hypothetical protein